MSNELDDVRIERAAGADDALAMAALNLRWDREGGAQPRPGFLDDFAQAWLEQADVRPAWLARRTDGDPVGFAVGTLATSLPTLRHPIGGWLHLSRLYITPDARGAGLGERLLREVIDWSRQQGLFRVQLNAADRARPLYRRVGFGGPQDTLMQLVLTDRLPTS